MKINSKVKNISNAIKTHEYGPAYNQSYTNQLLRSVLANMLWEDTFYENGKSIADRIASLVNKVDAEEVAAIAEKARTIYNLRHVPLLLLNALAKSGRLRANYVHNVINRADELAELLAIYWKDGKSPISKQLKLGLASAFTKFDAYQLAKYSRKGNKITLRDVMFLVHPKPNDRAQEVVFNKLADGTLESPDTWETALSAGNDKAETFSRLLREHKLGYMALLRNLRNMRDSGVPYNLIKDELLHGAGRSKVLPFRFLSAAKVVPQYEDIIEQAMLSSLWEMEKLPGKTILLVDVSGSMRYDTVSKNSDLVRQEAAAALAALVREVCEQVEIFTFDNRIIEVPSRRGFGLIDYISKAGGGGTLIGAAVNRANKSGYDRVIVFTDEQSADAVPQPLTNKAYMINVGSYNRSIVYGKWKSITGFSDAVINWIREYERSKLDFLA